MPAPLAGARASGQGQEPHSCAPNRVPPHFFISSGARGVFVAGSAGVVLSFSEPVGVGFSGVRSEVSELLGCPGGLLDDGVSPGPFVGDTFMGLHVWVALSQIISFMSAHSVRDFGSPSAKAGPAVAIARVNARIEVSAFIVLPPRRLGCLLCLFWGSVIACPLWTPNVVTCLESSV